MRPISAPERALLAGDHNVHLRLEVRTVDGTWVDLSSFGGVDWVEGATWGTDIDQAAESGSIFLAREVDTGAEVLSLAPMITASSLNRNAAGEYVPFLYPGRRFRLSAAITAVGAAPVAGDWREVLTGKIDTVNWVVDPIELMVRDLGAILLDTWIEQKKDYGTAGGVAGETIMQQIVDENVPNPPTLYVPAASGWMVRTFPQDKASVMQALRDLAIQRGWELRYRYDSAGVSRLTFLEPARTPAGVDTEIGPDEYFDVRLLSVSDADVRSVVRVTYEDVTLGLRSEERFVQASIDQFGRRFMEIGEASASNIDTAAEAGAMADAAVNDLAFPIADQEIETSFFWPVQVGDYYRFLANGVHYDSDQDFGVVGYQHELKDGGGITTLLTRGKPVGAFRQWLARGGPGSDLPVSSAPVPGVALSLNGTNNIVVDLSGSGLQSFRVLVSKYRSPAAADIRTYGTLVNANPGQHVGLVVGTNERRYVGVFGYTELGAGGLESEPVVEILDRGVAANPKATITDQGTGEAPNTEVVRYDGTLGHSNTGPLEWRRELRRNSGTVLEEWTDWEPFYISAVTDVLSRAAPFPAHNVVFLQVRDPDGGETTEVSLNLPPPD